MKACNMEMLESRLFLDGNVTAVLNNSGVLKITGDALNNEMTAAVVGADLVITPALGTTINDGGAATFALADITKIILKMRNSANDVDFDLTGVVVSDALFKVGKGVNDVTVTGLETTGNMKMFSGNGGNTLLAETLTVGENLQLKGGKGLDTITADTVDVTGELLIKSGKAADVITLDTVTAANVVVQGSPDGTVAIIGDVPANLVISGPVIANNAPTVTNAAALLLLEIPADAINLEAVTLADGITPASVVGADLDNNPLTYAITSGNDLGIFAIDPTTGALVAADVTDLGPATTVYNLTVTVSDYSDSVDAPVVITVTAVI